MADAGYHGRDNGEGDEGNGFVSGYRWTCSMCRGLGLIDDFDDDGVPVIEDCPKHSMAAQHDVVFEIVKRNISPATSAAERLASPAVGSCYRYEVWRFLVAEGLARCETAEPTLGLALTAQRYLEDEAYGVLGGAA
jgi:hypothetical protein